MTHLASELWTYAARELNAFDLVMVEEHLAECLECREQLAEVRMARWAVREVAALNPQVNWARVDASVHRATRHRSFAKSKQLAWHWLGAGAAVAMAALLALHPFTRGSQVRPAPLDSVAEPLAQGERAQVRSVFGKVSANRQGESRDIEKGQALSRGEVLRTGREGSAVLELPDESELTLGPDVELSFDRLSPSDLALRLECGAVRARASHRTGRSFVVVTHGLVIRVVGTVFDVQASSGEVEIAVSEGRVLVEPPEAAPFFLSAGHRIRVKTKRPGVALPTRPKPPPSERSTARAQSISAAGSELQASPPNAIQEGQNTPTAAVDGEPGLRPEQLSLWPGSSSAVQTQVELDPLPSDLESLFLRRAEAGLGSEHCTRFRLGLTEIIESSENPVARAKARLLRARCAGDEGPPQGPLRP